ncbi:GRPL2 protein, partial [Trogon melanurus]|nr:GRPL2 protein [Trogon melanurus]
QTWDAALARTAKAWANKCIFKHNIHLDKKHQSHPNFTSIGENIWIGSHQLFGVADAVKSWYDEVKFSTFAEQKCTKVCSHYIQVVWDYSHKIGCAVTFCKKVAGIPNAANFICNYLPGIDSSRPPYLEGSSCSTCEKEDTCEKKLCNYPRWHPPWDSNMACDEPCITLTVLRVWLMFLAFAAVYFSKNHFTNIHVST